MPSPTNRIHHVLQGSQVQLLADWIKSLRAQNTPRASHALGEQELQAQCQELIALLADAVSEGKLEDITAESWKPVRDFLGGVSRSRSRQGFSPSETAMFVMSIKEPLFLHLRRAFEGQSEAGLFND